MAMVTGTPAAGVDELAEVLGVDPGDGPADPVRRAWGEAVGLIEHELTHQFRPIEAPVLDALRLEVAQECFKRMDTAAGGGQFVDFDGQQLVRAPRDPLNRSYPTLAKYRVAL